ncbi:MAG: hypothetical protein MAG451_00570 [Anaerolineales bacterium]|nr:hypothetical protein [Anaerolineales bacterium]
MPPKVQALAVLSSLGLLVFILYLIRKGRLREEHALLWLMTGFSIFVLSAWRGSLTAIARMLDIGYAPSLLFAVGFVFTLLILLAQTAVMSRLTSHTRDLAQELSLLEWQVQNLEARLRRQTEAGTYHDHGPKTDRSEQTSIPSSAQARPDDSILDIVDRKDGALEEEVTQ